MNEHDKIYRQFNDGKWALVDAYYDPEGYGYKVPDGTDGQYDLRFFWKCFDRDNKLRRGFVCPCCLNVWCHAFAGMPGSFVAHIGQSTVRSIIGNPRSYKKVSEDMFAAGGCFFRQNGRIRAAVKSDLD
jgi:hypothetical protein